MAPAGGFRKPALGRPREPIGRHYDRSARSSLDWDRSNGFGPAKSAACPKGGAPRPRRNRSGNQETRTRGQKSPPWSAERRPRSPKGNAARRKTGAPLGAPFPSLFRGGKGLSAEARKGEGGTTAYPAPQRIRAMTHACLEFGCLTIGSERTRVFPRGSGRTESYRRSTSASRTAPLI